MTKSKTIFSHEVVDDFTTRSIEVTKHTYKDGDEYMLKIHETFEKDSNGETESLSSISLTETETVELYKALQKSIFGLELLTAVHPYDSLSKEMFMGVDYAAKDMTAPKTDEDNQSL